MTDDGPAIPKRFAIARRWQWPAAAGVALFFLACFVGWPLGYLWPSAAGLVLFLPAVALFNIRCHACGYPAFADYQADERERTRQLRGFWARFWGREPGGVHLPLRSACSKCGARFSADPG